MSDKSQNFIIRHRSIQSLRNLYPSYLNAISKSSCDKYNFEFKEGEGSRSWAHKALTFHLETLTGYYGDSSCSQFGSIGDPKLYQEAFIKYLNRNKVKILNDLASIIEEGLDKDREEYLEKLRTEIERVEATKKPLEEESQ